MIILPSLEIVPAKYNVSTNTLLSQIPIDGTGDFTVTRATSPTTNQSTRVNALGLIETVADNVPRLDYPIGGGCPALLVEPSAQNLCLQSEDLDIFPWNTTNTAVTVNVTGTTDPAGGNKADQIFETAASGLHFLAQTMTIVNGTTYAGSVFLKKATGSPDWMQVAFSTTGLAGFANFNLTSGTVGNALAGCTGRIENYGNGWYRCTLIQTANANGTSGGPIIVFTNNTNSITRFVSYTGNTATSIYAWGAQLETGSVATSYIPTVASGITRAADVIRKTNITSLIGQSEGTVYFEVEVTAEARDRLFFTLDSASNSLIQGWVDSSRQVKMFIQNAGATVMTTLSSSALSIGYHKVAFAYNAATNGCEMFIDGVQNPVASRTVTGAGLPAFNNFTFGGFITSTTDVFKAHIRAGELHPNRLTNTQLALLTSPYTSYSSMASALSYTLG
jgi:hypothetical protein